MTSTARFLLAGVLALVALAGPPTGQSHAMTFSLDSPTVSEPATGTANLDFTISISGSDAAPLAPAPGIDYRVAAGTATAAADYDTVADGHWDYSIFGSTSFTVHVPVRADSAVEGPETVKLELLNPTPATAGSVGGIDLGIGGAGPRRPPNTPTITGADPPARTIHHTPPPPTAAA